MVIGAAAASERQSVMRLKLPNVAVAASLILCLSTCVLWARSYTRGHALTLSRTVWPTADSCVARCLTVQLVLGHCVVSWSRCEEDLSRPEDVRFNHALDVAAYRKVAAPGVGLRHFAYDIHLDPGKSKGSGTK